MAGIEFNPMLNVPTNRATEVSSNAPAQESIRRTSEIASGEKTAETEREEQKEAMQKAAELREAALENVVARSEDGDTVQVSEDGATELSESEEGNVVYETAAETTAATRDEDNFEVESENQAAETVVVETATTNTAPVATEIETAEAENDMVVNGPPFSGYTEQQLETMYLQGEISRSDYTTEESRREAVKEQVMESNSAVNRDMANVTAAGRRAEQTDFAIEAALNSESEIDIEDRLGAATTRQQNQARATEEAGRLWDYQLRA